MLQHHDERDENSHLRIRSFNIKWVLPLSPVGHICRHFLVSSDQTWMASCFWSLAIIKWGWKYQSLELLTISFSKLNRSRVLWTTICAGTGRSFTCSCLHKGERKVAWGDGTFLVRSLCSTHRLCRFPVRWVLCRVDKGGYWFAGRETGGWEWDL